MRRQAAAAGGEADEEEKGEKNNRRKDDEEQDDEQDEQEEEKEEEGEEAGEGGIDSVSRIQLATRAVLSLHTISTGKLLSNRQRDGPKAAISTETYGSMRFASSADPIGAGRRCRSRPLSRVAGV